MNINPLDLKNEPRNGECTVIIFLTFGKHYKIKTKKKTHV